MTMVCGGMVRNIATAAMAIATAVAVIVIAGQLFLRMSLRAICFMINAAESLVLRAGTNLG